MTTTNDAAERLRFLFRDDRPPTTQERGPLLDAALAAERRATVERYEPVLRQLVTAFDHADHFVGKLEDGTFDSRSLEVLDAFAAARAILDAEAER